MKYHRQLNKFALLSTTSLALAVTGAAVIGGAFPNGRGTDILHFATRSFMVNEGLLTNAVARIDARRNEQGHSSNQTLDVVVRGLDTNTTYQLWALLKNDTNWVPVTDFATDWRGRAWLLYRQMGQGVGVPRGRLPLPAVLDPITNIRDLAISDTSTQSLLSADMTMPDRLSYLVKRDLSTNGISAWLRIAANQQRANLRLVAYGLSPTNDYFLVFNGSIVHTNATNWRGTLVSDAPLSSPLGVLDLESVALWDSASNTVVSTTLP